VQVDQSVENAYYLSTNKGQAGVSFQWSWSLERQPCSKSAKK